MGFEVRRQRYEIEASIKRKRAATVVLREFLHPVPSCPASELDAPLPILYPHRRATSPQREASI